MANCKANRFSNIAPKWKFMLLILVSSLSFIIYDWRFYLMNLLITFILSSLRNSSYNRLLIKAITSSFYPLIIIFTMHMISGDWINGIKVILRLYNIILFASWVLLTTSHSEIMEGFTSLLKPLSYVGINPDKVSLSFTLAIRFIPLIVDTFSEIKMAQKARGIDKNFTAILIPLIIKTIKMADDIAEAIEARSWK